MRYLKVFNGKVITPSGIIPSGYVLASGDKIIETGAGNPEIPGATEIDAHGHYISPGFIDLHIHGGGGADFMDNTVEAFLTIANIHAKYGTTAMMPTTLSCGQASLLQTLDTYAAANAQNRQGAQFIGIHIEGPYFSMNQRGAQDPKYIHDPSPAEYLEVLAHSKDVKRWSIAPERPGAIEMGKVLKAHNILPSIAHTDAVYEEVLPAYAVGYTHCTHFYSAMSGVTRRNAFRYAGVIETAYLIDDMTVEIIADGIHLPASLLKLIYKLKGPENTALITDAMRAAATSTPTSILGSLQDGLPVIVEDGVAKLPDRSSFAGSVATADRLVRTMITQAGIPLTDAVRMITETPARIMDIRQKGTLEKERDADIVIFDENINIQTTIVSGNIIYTRHEGI
ncbi:N-acetylglucosamine-6-phosphate deacetylase [Chitinophaga terrae (ex Kim and Jung 2007)]|uniref:N-acetylglucosamine-6-phosphate deacetylase n=1 Tax=Chitinophaga terrae (ex Kim and Jung 2007) TaxID=408074 RepID=UPI002782003C|nr:N-acetylglucosamine-6-phosphate deacetylase [Chitinophaga terrae (ex Kim and Jung 2007)]MDQ0104922.1 N-acetylglucosamine-6-phosphate deacetylase [Chitinophaga terrae (ex Kim and Jung 2007)]